MHEPQKIDINEFNDFSIKYELANASSYQKGAKKLDVVIECYGNFPVKFVCYYRTGKMLTAQKEIFIDIAEALDFYNGIYV